MLCATDWLVRAFACGGALQAITPKTTARNRWHRFIAADENSAVLYEASAVSFRLMQVVEPFKPKPGREGAIPPFRPKKLVNTTDNSEHQGAEELDYIGSMLF
jgi:hypothetical protein